MKMPDDLGAFYLRLVKRLNRVGRLEIDADGNDLKLFFQAVYGGGRLRNVYDGPGYESTPMDAIPFESMTRFFKRFGNFLMKRILLLLIMVRILMFVKRTLDLL